MYSYNPQYTYTYTDNYFKFFIENRLDSLTILSHYIFNSNLLHGDKKIVPIIIFQLSSSYVKKIENLFELIRIEGLQIKKRKVALQ